MEEKATDKILTNHIDEYFYFGTKVKVIAGKAWEEGYNGTIVRLLNNGRLVEVRPDGENFKETSYRVSIERVFVTKVMEYKYE